MKKKLLALIARKKNEVAELQKRSDESQDLAEVRAIGETLKKLADEIKEAEDMLAELDDEGDGAGTDDQASRSVIPAGSELRNAQVVGAFAVVGYTDSNGAQLISYASSSVTFSPLYDTAFSSFVEAIIRTFSYPATTSAFSTSTTICPKFFSTKSLSVKASSNATPISLPNAIL